MAWLESRDPLCQTCSLIAREPKCRWGSVRLGSKVALPSSLSGFVSGPGVNGGIQCWNGSCPCCSTEVSDSLADINGRGPRFVAATISVQRVRTYALPERTAWRENRALQHVSQAGDVTDRKSHDRLEGKTRRIVQYVTDKRVTIHPGISLDLHSVFNGHPRRNGMCSKPCDQAKQHRHRISQANLLITPSPPDHAPKDHTHTPGDSALHGTSPRHSRPASPTRHNTHRKTDTPPQASHNPHS